jgi:hypothetical protein
MSKNEEEHAYDLLVIGGGASGMMAAGVAAENGKKVLLLEKNNELGKKLKITGGGRCNITNATYDVRKFLSKFGNAEQFLYSTFSQFGVQDTFDFFQEKRLPLVIEARDRVFPKSQKAMDVFKVMEKFITHKNIDVVMGSGVNKVNKTGDKIVSVKVGSRIYTAENYLIATGGYSHPETGSTGDGFVWLKSLGHTVKRSAPNIVPLQVADKWVRDLSGVSLSFMKITFYVNGKKAFSEKGKILFTHFGVSGPLILNLSHKVADLLHEGAVTATIDLYPDTDIGSLEKRILAVFDKNKNKSFKNVVKDITPEGLSNALIEFHIIPDVLDKVHSISREQRKTIVQLLKKMPMTIDGLMGMNRSVISDGGVPLTEIDTRTMKSKIISNLYLTGDVLHINRPSGGYSLQLCWTTGYVAGQLG